MFRAKKIWVQNTFCIRTIWFRKKIKVEKDLGLKKFWVQNKFGVHILTGYTCVQSFRLQIITIPVGLGWGGKHVVIMLYQFNWNFNYLLELSLAIWQVPVCKMEPLSGNITWKKTTHPSTRPPSCPTASPSTQPYWFCTLLRVWGVLGIYEVCKKVN